MSKCQCVTLAGKQCSRNAASGSNFCTQHKNCKSTNAISRPIVKPQKLPVAKPKQKPLPVAKPKQKPLPIIKPQKLQVAKPKQKPLPVPKVKPVYKPLPIAKSKTSNFSITKNLDKMPTELAQHILGAGSPQTLIKVCRSLPPNLSSQLCTKDLLNKPEVINYIKLNKLVEQAQEKARAYYMKRDGEPGRAITKFELQIVAKGKKKMALFEGNMTEFELLLPTGSMDWIGGSEYTTAKIDDIKIENILDLLLKFTDFLGVKFDIDRLSLRPMTFQSLIYEL